MATKSIVPRATGEGGIGTASKLMGPSYFSEAGLSADVRFEEAILATSSATPTVIWTSEALAAAGEMLDVMVRVVGSDPTGVTAGGYIRWITVRSRTTQGVTLLASDTIGTDNESTSMATADVTAAIVDSCLEISVTGIAATTINWRAFIQAVYLR